MSTEFTCPKLKFKYHSVGEHRAGDYRILGSRYHHKLGVTCTFRVLYKDTVIADRGSYFKDCVQEANNHNYWRLKKEQNDTIRI